MRAVAITVILIVLTIAVLAMHGADYAANIHNGRVRQVNVCTNGGVRWPISTASITIGEEGFIVGGGS